MKDAEAGIAHKPPQRRVTWRSTPPEMRDQEGHASQRDPGGDMHVSMDDTDFDTEIPLLYDQLGYECSQNQEDAGICEDVEVESLDYDPVHSVIHDKIKKRESQQGRKLYGYTGLTLAKWAITITIGLLVGVVAFFIESSQDLIITYKKEWTEKLIDRGLGIVFINYAAIGVTLVLLSSCLVMFWAPAAGGGGVTLVMAYLNGNDIPDVFRHRTFFTKVFGTLCTVSSGLPIGQEGPMVHIGAAIASELTWMHGQFPKTKHVLPAAQTWWKKLTSRAWVFDFYNDKDRREFISAGAAAGLQSQIHCGKHNRKEEEAW